ncbi:MAG: ferrous iron transport protein A [Oligoflexia bacterium]|nr:ferrous iron transport protein A [Oligoflexia bacterium]
MSNTLLTELKKGDIAEIIAFAGGVAMLARLKAMGLSEGKIIKKLSDIRMGGPVILLVDRARIAIGKGMANKIIVEKQGNEEL